MKRLFTIFIALTLILTLAACSANTGESTELSDGEDTPQTGAEDTQTDISSTDEEASTAVQDTVAIDGVPEGFPQSMPIHSGAQILEADEHGDNGYTMIYMVTESYSSVVSFYQKAFPGVEKVFDEPDECYFENFDIAGGEVHVNGLTITNDGDYTAVFITLKYN